MKFTFTALLTLFLIGCSSTSINIHSNQIELKNDTFTSTIHSTKTFQDYKKLSTITIKQEVFKDEYHQLLVYEQARVLSLYQFRSNFSTIFSRIFDAKKVKEIRNTKGLGFYIVDLKNNQKVYLLAKTNSKKTLSFLYGFSELNFQNLLNQKPLQKQVNPSLTEPIQTQWNETLLITAQLLERQGGRAFRR